MTAGGDIEPTPSEVSPILAVSSVAPARDVTEPRRSRRYSEAFQSVLGQQVVRGTATYAIADVVNKGVPFILLPIVARYLSTADYGVLANFNVLTQIFVAFCALNTYSALSVSYFDIRATAVPNLLSNLLYLIGLLAAMSLAVTLGLTRVIEHYLALSRPWQLLALLTAVATAVYTLYLALLRMQGRAVRFSVIQIGQSLISSALAIALVVYLRWNWQGRAISIGAAATASMVFCLWSLRRQEGVFTRADRAQVQGAFAFGLPLLPHTMSFWIKTGLVKIVITSAIGLSANGIYSIALTLGSVVGIFTDAFFSAYSPSMYKDLSTMEAVAEADAKAISRRLVKNTYRFAAVLAVVCAGGWLAMHVAIPLLFRGDYVEAARLIPVVFLALYFDGLYAIVSGYVFYRRKTKVLGAITFSSSLVQVGLTVLLVHPFGLFGALYAGCFVSFLTFAAVLVVANRLYALPWRLSPVD
jgi:O-antigen/teichoic acid export membrane protein